MEFHPPYRGHFLSFQSTEATHKRGVYPRNNDLLELHQGFSERHIGQTFWYVKGDEHIDLVGLYLCVHHREITDNVLELYARIFGQKIQIVRLNPFDHTFFSKFQRRKDGGHSHPDGFMVS